MKPTEKSLSVFIWWIPTFVNEHLWQNLHPHFIEALDKRLHER
jgi:hypothetical protein